MARPTKQGRDIMFNCVLCCRELNLSEPTLNFKDKLICLQCRIDLTKEIYHLAGSGDGGITHLLFSSLLHSKHNRKRRVTVNNYKAILAKLLHKYNFSCVVCGSKNKLSIDHIKPVSKGGSDDEVNLQILCRSCNSKKGNKWHDQ